MLAADTRIEDLWVKYFCVSTNLTRAEGLVHEDGPLYKWLLATASLPGYYPPIPVDGDLLVDGGLLNLLPADVMRRLGVGTIIGVDVTVRQDLRTDMTYQDYLSGWPLLWARLNPSRGSLASRTSAGSSRARSRRPASTTSSPSSN